MSEVVIPEIALRGVRISVDEYLLPPKGIDKTLSPPSPVPGKSNALHDLEDG